MIGLRALAPLAILVAAPALAAAPRAYVCPMHPDVRRATAGSCPRCKMALVPTAIDRLDAFFLDVELDPPAAPAARPLRLRLAVRDPATRAIVRDFAVVHEHPLHLFVVSEDLAWLAHVHPAQAADGVFTVELTLPRAGRYQLVADFVPEGAPPQLLSRVLVTAGHAAPLGGAHLAAAPSATVEGVTFALAPGAHPVARLDALELELSRGGAPVTDLQPYLGADVHVLIVSEDLATTIHEHGERIEGRSALRIPVRFPRAGRYRVFAQVRRGGEVLTAALTADASGAVDLRP